MDRSRSVRQQSASSWTSSISHSQQSFPRPVPTPSSPPFRLRVRPTVEHVVDDQSSASHAHCLLFCTLKYNSAVLDLLASVTRLTVTRRASSGRKQRLIIASYEFTNTGGSC